MLAINKNKIFEILKSHETKIKNFGVNEIGIFGSFANGSETENSYINFLVLFDENQLTFDNYFDLKFFLESLFERKIDVVTSKSIKNSLKDNILNSVIYAS